MIPTHAETASSRCYSQQSEPFTLTAPARQGKGRLAQAALPGARCGVADRGDRRTERVEVVTIGGFVQFEQLEYSQSRFDIGNSAKPFVPGHGDIRNNPPAARQRSDFRLVSLECDRDHCDFSCSSYAVRNVRSELYLNALRLCCRGGCDRGTVMAGGENHRCTPIGAGPPAALWICGAFAECARTNIFSPERWSNYVVADLIHLKWWQRAKDHHTVRDRYLRSGPDWNHDR